MRDYCVIGTMNKQDRNGIISAFLHFILYSMLIMALVVAWGFIGEWFFDKIISERDLGRITVMSFFIGMYGMFCKTVGKLADEKPADDPQYNKIIVGGAILLASFIAWAWAMQPYPCEPS